MRFRSRFWFMTKDLHNTTQLSAKCCLQTPLSRWKKLHGTGKCRDNRTWIQTEQKRPSPQTNGVHGTAAWEDASGVPVEQIPRGNCTWGAGYSTGNKRGVRTGQTYHLLIVFRPGQYATFPGKIAYFPLKLLFKIDQLTCIKAPIRRG